MKGMATAKNSSPFARCIVVILKLGAKAEAAGQRVNAKGIANGTGLRFLPVEHS
ncbi:hypothetical protein [Novosphingobium sp. 32-60-15]|uniref:hypothetical protein n=1 Tax=Novosphingobium sp. 32-60-15 TaxID=1970410 RepID=UPI0025D00485|nr:hypothetical protein [Novosphingobium sp. 32-60-15]